MLMKKMISINRTMIMMMKMILKGILMMKMIMMLLVMMMVKVDKENVNNDNGQ